MVSSATETTATHSAAVRSLVVGDSVTVSGHTDAALNQVYLVKTVTSATEVVLTGTGLTSGTYTSGSPTLTYSIAAKGNLCHVECSNRGLCNYNTGLCSCFKGWHGEACGNQGELSFE